MNYFLLTLGILLLIFTFLDALLTVLWVDGAAGPITSRVTTSLWRGFRSFIPREKHRLLSLSGPTILTVTLFMWVALLWTSWVLIFGADGDSILSTRDQGTADVFGRIYFVAYTLFTVGNGDFQPNGSAWQVATSLTAASGIILVTLVVSYLLSVVSAVVQKRSFASQITGLGHRAEDFVIASWDGQEFQGLNSQLVSMTAQLGTLADQHLAYPILFHYHSANPKKASAPAIAIFDDALTLLQFGVRQDVRPGAGTLHSARSAVRSYLDSLASGHIGKAKEVPGAPNLQVLREAGIPVVSDEEFTRSLHDLQERRKLLLGMVHDDSYSWPPIHPGGNR